MAEKVRCGLGPEQPGAVSFDPCQGSALGDWIFAPGGSETAESRLGSGRRTLRSFSGAADRTIASSATRVEGIERELVRRVRAGAPTRRVLCALAARAIDIRSAARLGFARTRDQARERHGISARSLQELARVHRVLAQAPALDAAFQAGRLGWTALRSLARLERIEAEALWIGRATALPLRELERAVRDARRVAVAPAASSLEAAAEDETDACIPLACARRVRAKWALGRELARRVAGGRLPRWECAEVVAAEASTAAPPGPALASDLDEELDAGVSLGDLLGRHRPRLDGSEAAKAEPGACGAAEGFAGRAGADEGAPIADGRDAIEHRAPASVAAPIGSEAVGSADPSPPPPELPPGLARLLAGLEQADAFEVDRRLQQTLARERTHEARIGPLLRRVLEERLYRRAGYWDRDRYLEERLGLCPRKARALVRIERLLNRAPDLSRAYRSGALSWVQMQALAPLFEAGAGCGHASAWVDRARSVTVRRLQDDVRGALAMADLDGERFARTGGLPDGSPHTKEVEMEERKTGARRCGAAHARAKRKTRAHSEPAEEGRVRWQTRARPESPPGESREDATITFHAPAESARFFRAVLEAVRARLAAGLGTPVSEGEAFEAMLDHAIANWSERDARTRREHRILERDGWRCAVPGCTSHRNLQVHHVVFRSHGGSDEPENLVTLCAWHHQRGVHGGRVRITGRAPDRLRFELGLRDGEPPLVVYESGDRLVR